MSYRRMYMHSGGVWGAGFEVLVSTSVAQPMAGHEAE